MDEKEMAERIVKAETKIEAMAHTCERCWSAVIPGLEARLRSVEYKLAMWCGGLAVLQVLVGAVLAHILRAPGK